MEMSKESCKIYKNKKMTLNECKSLFYKALK